jgi:hypothetical protein
MSIGIKMMRPGGLTQVGLFCWLIVLLRFYRVKEFDQHIAEAVFAQGAPSGTKDHFIQFELGFPTNPMLPTINGNLIKINYALKYSGSISMACSANASLPILVGFAPVIQQAPPVQHPMGQMPMGQMPMGQMPMGQMPMGQVPMGQMPMGQVPMGQMPMGQMPMGQMPMGQMPSGHLPFAPMSMNGMSPEPGEMRVPNYDHPPDVPAYGMPIDATKTTSVPGEGL